MPESFLLTAITADPEIIRAADAAGVDRIGIDIERIGKTSRQGHLAHARFAAHVLDDLRTVSAETRHAAIFARLNPLHGGSRDEIECALALGARVLMLPYFTHPREVASFVEMIDRRATAVPLLETAEAAARVSEVVAIDGLTEIMVGLNDLHLSLGLSSPFEVLTSELMATIASRVRDAGLRFGFGGLARVGDVSLPVAPDLVCAQYARLGGTAAWLARSFYAGIAPHEIAEHVSALRQRLRYWSEQPPPALAGQRERLALAIQPAGVQRL